MKTIFFVAVAEENKKCCAFVVPVRAGNNLRPIIERYSDCPIFHLCETRKQADEIVCTWNDAYKRNGNYLFA